MEKSFGLYFFIKKSKSSKAVEHFIYLHITVDCVGCDISTKRKWDPAKWNADAGRAEGKTEIVRSLNSYLDLLQRKVYEARQQLLHHGHPVTAENIKTVFYGKEIHQHKNMLMELFKKHNDQMAELVGQEYAPGTLERFQTAYRHTLSFLQFKYKVAQEFPTDRLRVVRDIIPVQLLYRSGVRRCKEAETLRDHNRRGWGRMAG